MILLRLCGPRGASARRHDSWHRHAAHNKRSVARCHVARARAADLRCDADDVEGVAGRDAVGGAVHLDRAALCHVARACAADLRRAAHVVTGVVGGDAADAAFHLDREAHACGRAASRGPLRASITGALNSVIRSRNALSVPFNAIN